MEATLSLTDPSRDSPEVLLTLSRPLQSLLLATLGPLLGQACIKWHLMVAMMALEMAPDGLTSCEQLSNPGVGISTEDLLRVEQTLIKRSSPGVGTNLCKLRPCVARTNPVSF